MGKMTWRDAAVPLALALVLGLAGGLAFGNTALWVTMPISGAFGFLYVRRRTRMRELESKAKEN